MGKALIIAEKPSVASDISKALGGFKKHEDYYESDRYVISSAVGHLLELCVPDEFEVKRGKWSFANLPMIPPHFGLRPIERNEARLKKMGIEGLPVRTLFRNAYFTPTLQSSLVLALESLGNVPGRDDVIAFAARAASETEARYVINSVSLLAQHNSKVAPLARIRGADNVIAGETRDGKLIISAPLDYIPWVKPADDFARRTDLKGSERWLLISGTVTPRAKQELTTLGWRISDNLATAK